MIFGNLSLVIKISTKATTYNTIDRLYSTVTQQEQITEKETIRHILCHHQ